MSALERIRRTRETRVILAQRTTSSVSSAPSRTAPSVITWTSIALIVITGLIHAIDAPSSYGDAPYKGILFVLNALGASVAAYGIWRDERWGWALGILVAGGAFVMYVISRTVGLPQLPVDDWGEPIGIASLIVEAAFVVIAARMLAQPRRVSGGAMPR